MGHCCGRPDGRRPSMRAVTVPPHRIAAAAARGRPTLRACRRRLRLITAFAAVGIVLGLAVSVSNIVASELRQSATDDAQSSIESIVRGHIDPVIEPASLDLGGTPDPSLATAVDRTADGSDIRAVNILS